MRRPENVPRVDLSTPRLYGSHSLVHWAEVVPRLLVVPRLETSSVAANTAVACTKISLMLLP
ncbi:MAG: hypothetical protein QXY49_04280 [Thermofilaceae archaeon]